MSEINISKETLTKLLSEAYEGGMIEGYNMAMGSIMESLKAWEREFNKKYEQLNKETPCAQ